MDYKLEDKLLKEFNFYKGPYGRGISFECGDGWFDLLYELSKGIQSLIDAGLESLGFNVYQVKEKFATLRYYCNGTTWETDKLITEAVEKSAVTCEDCGKPGICRNINGWYRTLCDECYQTNLIRLEKMFIFEKDIKRPEEEKEAEND